MARPLPRLAFYYGERSGTPQLHGFDVAVLEAGHGFRPAHEGPGTTLWLGYVSIGEVLAGTPHFEAMPGEWLQGCNTTWGGRIIDQTAPGWPDFLVDTIAAPMWRAGYRGFFLDTMDSYLMRDVDPAEHRRQRQGLARAVRRLRAAFPSSVIIVNRGFELVPTLADAIDAVAFESLYAGWNEDRGRYVEVPAQDRAWLLDKAAMAGDSGLPVISIDYCPPEDLAAARQLISKIASHGLVPCVGDKHLQCVATLPSTA